MSKNLYGDASIKSKSECENKIDEKESNIEEKELKSQSNAIESIKLVNELNENPDSSLCLCPKLPINKNEGKKETIVTIDFLQDHFDSGKIGINKSKLEADYFLKHQFSNNQNSAVLNLEKKILKSKRKPGSTNQRKKERKILWNLTRSKY